MAIDDFGNPLLRAAAKETLERLRRDAAAASPKLRIALIYISENIFDPSLRISMLNKECGAAASFLNRRFRAELGTSPGDYVTERRCEIAQRLLAEGSLDLAEVAALVGFPSLNTFIHAFRRQTGVTPGAMRTESRSGSAPDSDEALMKLRRCLLGHDSVEDVQSVADAFELAHRRGHPPVRAEQLRDTAGQARLEARAFELLRPRYRLWPTEKQHALARQGYRHATPAFFRRLVRQSREEGRDDRVEGLRLAKLALDSVWALRHDVPAEQLSNLLAEALANLGNARRLLFDHHGARRALAEAEAKLAEHPAPAELEAEVLRLKGVLRQSQRCFPEARELLSRSLAKAVEPISRAHALLTRGVIHELLGDDDHAESDWLAALKELEGSTDHYARLSAHAHLAVLFARRGDHGGARAEAWRARQLVPEVGSRGVTFHLSWVEGLLSQARGEWGLAEQRLLEAREGFSMLQDPVFTPFVDLDVALLLCEKGRMAEVEQLMAEALPLFEKLSLDAEGLAALRLLRRAAARRRITTALLERARSHFETTGMIPRRP